jgi:hypothetical protein
LFAPIADALTKAATDCGAKLDPLQIDLEICLPGYIEDICQHVLETGERSCLDAQWAPSLL